MARSSRLELVSAAAVAAALGTMALVSRARARQAEREHAPRGAFIGIDGIPIHYVERGDGAPVVLLHGNGATAEDFALSGLHERLAERHRVIAFDRPGFGHTPRPGGRFWGPRRQAALLAKAIERLGAAPALVVGHSWGTLVALALALDHRASVRALALLGGYYFPRWRGDVALAGAAATPVIGDLLCHTILPLLGVPAARGMFSRIFAPLPVPPRFAAEFPTALAVRPSQLKATAADTLVLTPAAAALARRYRELRVPVLIVTGRGDAIVDPDRQSLRLHRELPGSELLALDGVGHMLHYAAPARIAEAIAALHRRAS